MALVLVAWGGEGMAAEGNAEAVRIAEVAPELLDGWLVVTAEGRDLFSRKSLSTLQSGLPAVVRFEIELTKATQAQSLFSGKEDHYERVRDTEVVQSITYNVWDERYTVRGLGKTAVFAEFPPAERAVGRLERQALASAGDLEPMVVYAIRTRVQLIPISGEQGDRIADWLGHPRQLEAEASREPDGRGSQFDINGLLSVFWGRDEKSRNRSDWSPYRTFRISETGELIE